MKFPIKCIDNNEDYICSYYKRGSEKQLHDIKTKKIYKNQRFYKKNNKTT